MKMGKSTYYYEISKVDAVAERNIEFLRQIIDIFKTNKGKYGKSFDAFAAAVKEYVEYYNKKRLQSKNKMDAPCKIQKASISSI